MSWIVRSGEKSLVPWEDDPDFHHQCFKGWPVDSRGAYTRLRSIQDSANAVNENTEAHWPIDDESDFHQSFTLMIGEQKAGYARFRVWGSSEQYGRLVWVKQTALAPQYIGQGHFEDFYLLFKRLVFEVYVADAVGRTDFASNPALKAMRGRRAGYIIESNDEKRYPTETGEPTVRVIYTRDAYAAEPSETAYERRDGRKVIVEHSAEPPPLRQEKQGGRPGTPRG